MENKFCTVCGKERINIGKPVYYNGITGVPIYNTRCPDNPCHQGHDDDEKKIGFFFPKIIKTCKICGRSQIHKLTEETGLF